MARMENRQERRDDFKERKLELASKVTDEKAVRIKEKSLKKTVRA